MTTHGEASESLVEEELPTGDDGVFAAKLNGLIARSASVEGRRPSSAKLAEALRAEGTMVSASSIGYLRDGHRSNPTLHVLNGLARHFGVSAEYFFSDEPISGNHDPLLSGAVGDDMNIRAVVLGMRDLKPATRKWLAEQLLPKFVAMERDGPKIT